MNKIPSILVISWNRLEYLERAVTHLLDDPSDFLVYFWDNGSKDGARDFISDLRDDRIVVKKFNIENVKQYQPWHWFLETCTTDIAGKYDDDILGEVGWMARFSAMIANEPRLGLLASWVYQPSEWDLALAEHKIQTVGQYEIFRNLWVPGGIFLGHVDLLRRFSKRDPSMWGLPVDHLGIYRSGAISGLPVPISWAEHLDDPRNPACRMNRPGGWDEFAAYTARMRNFTGPEDYGAWIAKDARECLTMTLKEQEKMIAAATSPSLIQQAKSTIRTLARRATHSN